MLAKGKVIQPIIDTGVFWLSNEIAANFNRLARVDMSDGIIYLLSSTLIQNGQMILPEGMLGVQGRNGSIALTYAVLGTVYDLIMSSYKIDGVLKRKFSQTIIGFGGNALTDYLLKSSSYTAGLA